MTRRRLIILSVCILASIVCAAIVWFANAIYEASEAEKTLHAYEMVIDVVMDSVSKHSGHWPRSWQELESSRPTGNDGIWKWPDDRAEIAKRVRVDFTLSSQEVVRMTPTSFSAITQIGPNYGRREFRIAYLIESVRNSLAKSEAPMEPN